jgi:fumarate reductase flavoprotein subunit
MAWEVGAGRTDMHMGLMHHLPPPAAGPGGTSSEFNAFQRPTNIMVNIRGERFVSEDLGGSHAVVGNAISIQPQRAAFMIFDGATKNYYQRNPLNRFKGPGSQYVTFKNKDLDDNIREIQAKGYKYLYMADTLEGLCEQTGIHLEGLLKTIEVYNKSCKQGRDEVFYKKPENLTRPFNKKKPKFYAGRFFCGAYNTTGGIKINYKTEVVTEDAVPIPGLYAAGCDANNLYGHTYVHLAGNYMGFAINSGRMAAENAAEYIKSLKK